MEKKIENNIPIPESLLKSKSARKYPFDKMVIGDSFLFSESKDFNSLNNARSTCTRYSKILKMTFKATYVDSGIRVFRIN